MHTNVSNILSKLLLVSRTQAALNALREGNAALSEKEGGTKTGVPVNPSSQITGG
jgi:hypothetical protein